MKHEIIGGNFALADGTPLPLSKAVRAGDFVFLSGQLGFDNTGTIPSGIKAQTSHCIRNMASILQEASLDISHIVKTTIWLTDLSNFAEFNEVYQKAFPQLPPARSTVCSQLALPSALIEIEAIAYG